ncbi:MAG: L-threonylcarbamoyladenylate synthase [Methanomassiliicoccales archaeon]|nr:L-threonylcarbamoyladenylate synthase [Methanomassiliicoccales archaeon]MDO5838157.1 L-threonylcarbamoyladenylate synthase [Methanomassiliicoccales archaeon]MDY4579914.1 L-threonylcarbamoyladenylate synthase [Candidatus Methanarcanum hacksteinii]
MQILKCNDQLDQETLKNIGIAAEAIKDGKLVVYPTETVYGIAADIFNQKAIKDLYLAKNRPFDMPLSVAVADKEMVQNIAVMTKKVEKLIDAFLPGPLTIITKKDSSVSDIITSMSQKVGIRIPDNKVALELIRQAERPIIATSANLHSHPDAVNVQDAVRDFGETVPYYLDSGACTLGKPSTIVWIMDDEVEIIRQGAITKQQIEDVLND